MVHYVYILFSPLLERYYTGSTHQLQERMKQHNTGNYYDNWTAKGRPWELFFHIECDSKQQASVIETHIKRMKSSKYIVNLKTYPEMVAKLKDRYADC